MSTTTTRLALTKPSKTPGSTDPVDVGQLNDNSDILDKWAGCYHVTDGSIPTVAGDHIYNGAFVRENTSKNIWVANVSGSTITRTFVYFPYVYYARTTQTSITSSTSSYTSWGWDLFDANYSSPANASVAQKQGTTNFWVCPLDGIYSITVHQQWLPIAISGKYVAGILYVNSNNYGKDVQDTEIITPITNSATFGTNIYLHMTRRLSQNDTVGQQIRQDTGGGLDFTSTVEIACVCPL